MADALYFNMLRLIRCLPYIIGGVNLSEYLFPIKLAIIMFPIFAALFTLPFLIYQYRKHGYINYYRAFILYSFLLYMIVAYYLIILPLPKTRDTLSVYGPWTKHVQLKPFNFVSDFLRETSVKLNRPSTYLHIFKERAFQQPAFNGILLLPLGVYLRYYFKKGLTATVFISFCVSLFFELTQLSGLYGFYNAPYRMFDVDDLFMNTLGGFLGYIISVVFVKTLPNVSRLDDNVHLEDMPVGFVRRSIALAFDWSIFIMASILTHWRINVWLFIFIYFILITYITNGRTFGKWLLRVKVTGRGQRISIKEVLIRYGVLYYGFFGVNYYTLRMLLKKGSEKYYIIMLLITLMDFAAFLHITIRFFSRNKLLFHDKISGTRLTITK